MEKIGIIAPAYNEEKTINRFLSTYIRLLSYHGFSYKFFIIDDGSKDSTVKVLLKAKKKGIPIKIISLNKNFGQHNALFAGIDNLDDDIEYIIITDIDLQNPP